MENINKILQGIGFNRLESDVYIYMLTNEPSTAYKVGKKLNKPTANVYKAIESLVRMGAVIVEDNKNKICKAINPEEFLNLYQNSIIEKTNQAKLLLKNLENEHLDQKSYTIESVPLVFERFRAMMNRCKSIAVVDAFPKTLEKVVDSLEAAALRGVEVYVEVYQPIEIKGVDVTCAVIGDKSLAHWKSQQLNLIIDGEEHLIALLDDKLEKVKQAIWSNSIYMSCMLHAGSLREQTIMKIMAEVDNTDFCSKVKDILNKQKFFFNSNIEGFNKLSKI